MTIILNFLSALLLIDSDGRNNGDEKAVLGREHIVIVISFKTLHSFLLPCKRNQYPPVVADSTISVVFQFL